jgi:serine/threonine protein kinase
MTPEDYWPAVELFAQLQDMAVEERQAALDAAWLLRAKEVQSLSPGTVLGNYRLGRRIGAGGVGIVYEAQDQQSHRPVALKILPQPFAAEGSERIKRFRP